MFNREVKVIRKARIKIMLSLIKNERELRLLENEKLKNLILSILQFKDLKTKKLREKDNKAYRESSLLKLFFEQQLLLIIKSILLLLNIRLSFVIIRFKTLTTTTRILL